MPEFSASLKLAELDATGGFRIDGVAAEDGLGFSVSGAGNVNGDGFNDFIIGAPYADPSGSNSGPSFVVFSKANGFAANFDLTSLYGTWGDDVITDFEDGVDLLDFSGSGLGFGDLTISQAGGDTLVEHTFGNSITLQGITATDITVNDFLF